MLLSRAEQAEYPLFLLLVFLLPSQLGLHFWPSFTNVLGIRIDYLAPTFYLTDFLVLLLFLLNLTHKNALFKIHQTTGKIWLVFVATALPGLFLAKNQWLVFYGLLKLAEITIVAFLTFRFLSAKGEKSFLKAFSLGIILECVLALFQIKNQASIGGIWYFLGERYFTSQTPGIANASINGELVLRPYATFPHPNVLAFYLLLGIVLILLNWRRLVPQKTINFAATFYIVVLVLASIVLLLTLARSVFFFWLVFLFVFSLRKWPQKRRKFLVVGMLIFVLLLFIFAPLALGRFKNLFAGESYQIRKNLLEASLSMIRQSWFLGVGKNNFLLNLPFYLHTPLTYSSLQPVHNIFVLVLAEQGIFGLLSFTVFLLRIFWQGVKQKEAICFWLLLLVFWVGLEDHYLLTLQQGQLLFALVIGICFYLLRKKLLKTEHRKIAK